MFSLFLVVVLLIVVVVEETLLVVVVDTAVKQLCVQRKRDRFNARTQNDALKRVKYHSKLVFKSNTKQFSKKVHTTSE